MDFLSESDIAYLISAAHDTCHEPPRYLPQYIPYRLSKEAEKMIENQIPTYYTQHLKSEMHKKLSFMKDKRIPACPEGYEENDSTLQVLVRFYKINQPRKFKSLRTALKMLIRLERGITSEKDFFDFLRENELPEEVLKDTEYDRDWFPIQSKFGQSRFQGNMNVPSKRDIAYLIDAAEKTSFDDDIPKYFPCLLYREAYKALERLERHQKCSLIGHAKNNRDLAIKFRSVFPRIKGDDIYFPECPEEYGKNDPTIKQLVECYREYIKKKKIDQIRKEDEKHKKWGTLSANFQKFEARSAMREEILAMSKALRTALKMLCRVEGGKTEEDFIRENGIPEEFLQDTEYDEDVTYNIIPFDGPDLLPEVQEAIKSLKLGLKGFAPRNQRHDVLDRLQKFFGFQGHSVKNQRENIVNLLSNEQMRPFTPGEHGTAFEDALENVFLKSLDNYTKWCRHLSIEPIWKNDENRKKKRIVYISLYYLIWGEAANVRFLPECLCYIFHRMSEELDRKDAPRDSFIKRVIKPLYEVIAAEAAINKNRDTSHSKWRNYDDFNEYFWSIDCFQLNLPFFHKPPKGSTTVFGKTSFVERRTFLHLYHSFHRMWIFHVMMFEALVIFAFNDGELNLKTLTETLTVTYFLMKLIQSILDIWLKYGAYSNTSCVDVLRILARFFWSMLATLIICFPRMKCLQEKTGSVEESIGFENFISVLGIYAVNFWKCFQEKTSLIEELIGFKNYIIVLGVYAFSKISFSISYQFLPQIYENSFIAPLIKWINQEEYVGRGMGEKRTDIFWYMLFWLVTLGFNVALTYYGLISPLVIPTRDINIHNMLAIGSLWAGVVCAYIVGSHVSYNVTSAFVGTFVGHTERLGNIKFLGDVHKCFDKIPTAFMKHNRESPPENDQEDVKKLNAAEFSPFWNKIVMNLREEDYISDFEQYALNMPENSGSIDAIHWPPFLLFGKVFHAIRLLQIAQQHTQSCWREVWESVLQKVQLTQSFLGGAWERVLQKVQQLTQSCLGGAWERVLQKVQQLTQSCLGGVWERVLQKVQQLTQSCLGGVWERLLQRLQQQQHTLKDLWNEISRDDVYMKYAVEECFHSVKFILLSVLKDEGKKWVEGIYEDIESSIARDGNLPEFQLNGLESFVKAISELTKILNIQEEADNRLIYSAEQALQNVIRHYFLGNKRFAWLNISVIWPEDPELRSQIKRLHFLLTTKSAAHVPRNREARRRLEFYTNSLFMSMPKPKPVRKMLSFSVLTPYYEETVLYSLDELESSNDDGVTIIDYLKNLYPDEWTNYCERMKKRYTDVDRDRDRYEYRLWASYRGQTLARTVRGTMYYQKALLLQAYREMLIAVGLGEDGQTSTSVPDVPMDEDMLKSLEKRSSNGEILMHTFRIHLGGEKNYNRWKEYMIKMLESQATTVFVDPKGESHVKYVRNYPQKWEKLDKKVKDWIMASLDDPLKNMVKEMKTAKELWKTLEIFFTPDTGKISSVNVTKPVSFELLNKDHYRKWVLQMENFLQAKGMFGYINGKLKDPDPKGKSHLEIVKIYSRRWKELDGQVKEWIRVSLSESMYDAVKDSETAEQMWDALKEIIGSQCLDYAKAHVDLKFTYVVSCQIYGNQKSEGKDVAADIAFLLKKNEGLRVAFIDEVFNKEGYKEFYSKLVKADKNGKEMEVYSIKLPGDPILGEGKPENQNHAIVFTRGNAIQTIDMNQDNYFEETLKMRNLLEEFHRKDDAVKDDAVKDDVIHPPTILEEFHRKDDVIHPPTILGIREHIFTGSASSLASFMSNQETGFVTLGQRVIANPLKVRMHYGHPDVFDRVFHITRGGISKASRGINISEDIYAGFNSTLRQGSVTHHEYIQVGKGRDVGFNQIATFEGKVAGGNGEQVLSRDIYRLGQRLDFFRMLSFYYSTVGYYFSSLLMVITLYILLYGNLIMALSGTRVPHVLNDIDMAPEWFLMIVLLPAIYMLLVPYLEQGLEKAVESFLAMFFSLGSIFFAFSLGTRIHWFGRTIIHGGASYQATGRGFVLHHIRFSDNYRRYSRSHFVKGMEVLFLVVVYIIYGFHSVRAFYNNLLLLGGSILSISWIVAPFLFDSSPFDPNKNSEDRKDWKNWINRTSDKVEERWDAWWNKEVSHIRTLGGQLTGTILSLRFFIFPLVVGYKLDVQGLRKSLSNCVIPWICVVVILFLYEVICKKPVRNFFSIDRVATIGALAIAYYYSAFGDMHAFIIAIITTVWGFISFFSNNGVATIGALAVAYYCSALGDMLVFFIAILATVWGFHSICVAWKSTLEIFSLWTPVKYLAWICDTGMRALRFNYTVSKDWGAWKPTLEIFSLWTPVKYLAWMCDTGMGALMFRIANMFSQRSIKQYLVRNMFDQNISELLHNSSTELKMQSTTWVGDPTTRNATSSSISKPPFYRSRDEYINMLPAMYHNFIVDVRDVDRDGNSGFRAVAVGLGRHQNKWKNIRSDLLQELKNHEKDYRKMFPGQYDIVKNRLTFFKDDEFAPEEKWMEMPAIGVLIASHFKVILHVIANSGNSLTFLPLHPPPPSWDELKFISLGHVNRNHFVHLLLKKGYQVPPLALHCHESEWKLPYEEWIQKMKEKKGILATIANVFFHKRL